MRLWRILAALCAATRVFYAASVTHAQVEENSREAQSSRRYPDVELVIISGPFDAVALASKISSWFLGRKQNITSRVEPLLTPDSILRPDADAKTRVWVAARSARTMAIYFRVHARAGGQARYLARDIELESGLDELGMEQVAQIVYLSALALWGGEVESSRAQLEEDLRITNPKAPVFPVPVVKERAVTFPARSSAPHRKGNSVWKVGSELAYSFRLRGAEGIAHGPRGAFRVLRSRAGRQWGGSISAQSLLPVRRQVGAVILALDGYALGLSAHAGLLALGHLRLSADVGTGADLVRHTTASVAGPDLEALPTRWNLRPTAWGAVQVDRELGSLSLGLRAALLVQFSRTHYDLLAGGQRTELLTPWRVQPEFSVHAIF